MTAVELMPVREFNEHQVTGTNPQTGQSLGNYWGYDPVAFYAVKASYSSSGDLGQQKLEFKEMIRAFHAAGIEVILDVVFLGRDPTGRLLANAPLLARIAEDPILRDVNQSPRRGTRPAPTRWAASPSGAGWNGTAGTEMTSDDSGAARMGCWDRSPPASAAAPTSTPNRAKARSAASTS